MTSAFFAVDDVQKEEGEGAEKEDEEVVDEDGVNDDFEVEVLREDGTALVLLENMEQRDDVGTKKVNVFCADLAKF